MKKAVIQALTILFLFHYPGKVFSVEPIYKEKKHYLQPLSSCSCRLHLAFNCGFPDTWLEICKGLSRWIQLDKANRSERFETAIRKYGFSYIDPYQGHRLVLDNTTLQAYQVLSGSVVIQFDEKTSFHRRVQQAGLEGDLVPRTFFTKEQALEAVSSNNVDVLFIKEPAQTAGFGMEVISVSQLQNYTVPRGRLIQEGLTRNLALFQRSRVLLRAHFIVIRGILYCHHRGFAQVHNAPFDHPASTSKEVQVSHGDYTVYNLDMRVPIRTPEFLDQTVIDQVWDQGLLDTHSIPNGTLWMDSIVGLGPRIGPFLEPIVSATYRDPLRYAYLGIDFIPLVDGSLKMLEINGFPAFRRFDVMVDVILKALDLPDSDLATRLVEMWKLPESLSSHNEL